MLLHEISRSKIPSLHPVDQYTEYFTSLKDHEGVLRRSDYDPLDIPKLLPWLMVLDETHFRGAALHRFRFVGTRLCEILGKDLTGRSLNESIPSAELDYRLSEFDEVRSQRKQIYGRGGVPLPGREFVEIIRGVFPVARDGEDKVCQFHVVIAPVAVRIQEKLQAEKLAVLRA